MPVQWRREAYNKSLDIDNINKYFIVVSIANQNKCFGFGFKRIQ